MFEINFSTFREEKKIHQTQWTQFVCLQGEMDKSDYQIRLVLEDLLENQQVIRYNNKLRTKLMTKKITSWQVRSGTSNRLSVELKGLTKE